MLVRKQFTCRYAISSEEFTSEMVGDKSRNFSYIKGKVSSWVGIPTSVALPFGVFEKVLSDDINQVQMISQTLAVVQNENLAFQRGKDGIKAYAPMPTKIGFQDCKALRDLSNVSKPLVFGGSKATNLKVKSAVCVRGTTKNAPRSNIPTDDEIRETMN